MVSYGPVVVGLFAKQMLAFQHPAVDSSRTKIFPYSISGNGAIVSVGVNLYNYDGELLVEDREIGQDNPMPGILFTVDLDGELRIDNAYIKPEYSGQKIGTQLICDLMETARKFGFDSAHLVADKETGAERYWADKHGFVSIDDSLRMKKKF